MMLFLFTCPTNISPNGKAGWLNEQVVQNIIDEANKRRGTIIGKQAPNLIMQDTNLKPVSLYDINKDFTVMFFWDPQCGHCKEETPNWLIFITLLPKIWMWKFTLFVPIPIW